MPDDHGSVDGPETMSEALERLIDDDDVDTMTYTLACTICVTTTEMYVRDQWDERARLCTVMRTQDDEAVGLFVRQLDLPDLPDETHPITYVRMMSEVLRERDGEMPDVDLVAWLFVVEAWMLLSSAERRDEYTAAAKARTIHAHPERTECRIAIMVDRAGRTYQTITERGGGEPWLYVSGTDDDDGGELSGAIRDAMRELMDLTPVES